ncbi:MULTISPECIES: hypothetical protein [unclassified Bacillus (in: firmicutes)]|uniref:hypothetical protein n=1 Tax=unclassified Bacillus (in: firmicutes) TaxID=185979 RepID=UPI001BE8F8B6|nr:MULTISPECIES: hypothetical protein [unclassified Bacillus (in: firmicutes)]MBT2614140.1 hypothetical protein [Bacillus sp. ISL-78]MBT2629349.1 hypothetical protein [Bacillus sp. ISL-101]
MELVRKFNIISQYLVEIDDVRPMGNMGTKTETWSWEISIAKHEEEYKGMAIERSRNIKTPWILLNETVLDKEMIQICKRQMPK